MEGVYKYLADNWIYWTLIAAGAWFGGRAFFKGSTGRGIGIFLGAYVFANILKDPEFYGKWITEGLVKLFELITWN